MTPGGSRQAVQFPLRRSALVVAVCAALWSILAEGERASWVVGVPVVLLASAAALVLRPPMAAPVSARGCLAFVPYFLWRSLAGAFDVALRAIRPGVPVTPSLVTYRLRVTGPARVFFVNALSLLPGTLAADLRGDVVTVHVLGGSVQGARLPDLEEYVARIFGGVVLDAPGQGDG